MYSVEMPESLLQILMLLPTVLQKLNSQLVPATTCLLDSIKRSFPP